MPPLDISNAIVYNSSSSPLLKTLRVFIFKVQFSLSSKLLASTQTFHGFSFYFTSSTPTAQLDLHPVSRLRRAVFRPPSTPTMATWNEWWGNRTEPQLFGIIIGIFVYLAFAWLPLLSSIALGLFSVAKTGPVVGSTVGSISAFESTVGSVSALESTARSAFAAGSTAVRI